MTTLPNRRSLSMWRRLFNIENKVSNTRDVLNMFVNQNNVTFRTLVCNRLCRRQLDLTLRVSSIYSCCHWPSPLSSLEYKMTLNHSFQQLCKTRNHPKAVLRPSVHAGSCLPNEGRNGLCPYRDWVLDVSAHEITIASGVDYLALCNTIQRRLLEGGRHSTSSDLSHLGHWL